MDTTDVVDEKLEVTFSKKSGEIILYGRNGLKRVSAGYNSPFSIIVEKLGNLLYSLAWNSDKTSRTWYRMIPV